MKVAISSDRPDLDARISKVFGRSTYILIVDPESLEYEAVENRQDSVLNEVSAQKSRIFNSISRWWLFPLGALAVY